MAEKGLCGRETNDIIISANRRALHDMKQNERALLQERVRTLVLRHALEATLQRLADLAGRDAEEDLLKLEHAIVGATRRVGAMPGDVQLATLVAVEDAVAVIRGAFDTVHQRIEAVPAPAALAA